MSNYPLPSTFGTPFNPNRHMESPAGTYDQDLPQYPYPYQNPSFPYGQGQMTGTSIVPHTSPNSHSFRSNAQGVLTPSSGNEVNGILYAPYGGKVQQSAFQTPVYPPMPFAHGVPSYGARPFRQPFTNSNHPSDPSTLFTNLRPAVEVQSTNIGDSDAVPPALSELEEGELDDEEVGKTTGQSTASTSTPSGVSQNKRHENVDSAESDSSRRAANAPIIPLPGLNQDSLAAPSSQHFTTSQFQQYSALNGFLANSNDPQRSRTAECTSVQHQLSTNTSKQGSKEVNQHLVDQKMEEAKQALRDLHSQGFDFDQIVNAGLDPGVLRKLYDMIEEPVTVSSDLLQRKMVKTGIADAPTESATERTHDQHPESAQKDSNGAVVDIEKLPNLVTEEVRINSQLTLAAAKNEGKSMQNQASLAKFSKSPNVSPLGKASGVKAGGTKILDRKEYIARMLAAKAGKPPVSTTIPESSQTPTVADMGAYAQVPSSATVAAVIPATIFQASRDSINTAPGSQKEDSEVEVKRKAQTDLARQKIEALKFRESFQQQARSATGSDVVSTGQQSPATAVPSIPAERPVPTPRALPSRQSSYFSPASQKPPFSIPGLFMTSEVLEPANRSKPLANEGIAVSTQRVGSASLGSSQEGLRPDAAVSAQSPAVDKTSSLFEASSDLSSALPATISTTTSFNRKRQRASDFIDSPPTRVKRPLGHQEDTSVIIDISDDEFSNDTSGDESLETADPRDSLTRKSQVIAPSNIKTYPIKSLPPLPDLPQRNKSVITTSPAAQASGQSGDLKGLKSKEMEIEVMNRKIAELEQRIAIKAKQTTSYNHSPGNSSRVTISPSPGEASHGTNNKPNMPMSVSDPQNDHIANVENQELITALAETNEIAAAEQLNAEQQLEEVERAKAEAERSLAAEITLGSTADQSITRDESIQTTQAEEQSNLREGGLQSDGEEPERVEVEEERCLGKGQSRQTQGEETKEFRQEEADRYLQKQAQPLTQGTREERFQEQKQERSLDDQRQARKSEIESGLPLLDAEVERTRKRLVTLRQEMAALETQLQKGIEGRQGLIEELHTLSLSREVLPAPMDLDVCDVPKQSISTEELLTMTEPSASVEMVPDLGPIHISGGVEIEREAREGPPIRTPADRMSHGELEEEIMDTSHSDVDEGELSLYSPKAAPEAQDTSGFVDDYENYEPPSEISITQRQEPDPDGVLLSQDLETATADLPAQTQNQPSSDLNAEHTEKSISAGSSPTASVNMAGDEQSRRSQSRSLSLASASDPDDYEPPEPASLGEEVPRSTHISSVNSETSFSPPDIEINDFVAHTSSDPVLAVHQQAQKVEPNRRLGHFTPYESPLKQFKSFRYHPRYLEEVSSGFRSLTYSHTINPDIPLCRYELDGVCNDDSCQSQHLRSVGLSDDKILVDLGAKPDDGSSPDEFGNGLREIIHDIRSRKIRDFNIVAGEITAYRAKFLGDSSKVLPL